MCYTYVLRVTACECLVQETVSERKSNDACSFRLGPDMTTVFSGSDHDNCVSMGTSALVHSTCVYK